MTTTSSRLYGQNLHLDGTPGTFARRVHGLTPADRSDQPLAPFPEGWYLVASRRAIERAALLEMTWMGKEIVAWCDDQGTICVADAFCPHLGSHVGPQAGGRVCEGRLVCPFHGFEFDSTGQCVATPFAAPPKQARLGVLETREIAGLIFAWYGIGDREPQWRLPQDPPAQEGWSRLLIETTRFRGHPQETTENAVDLAHLSYVHGFDRVRQVGTVSVEGPLLRTAFDFTQRPSYAGMSVGNFDVSARVTVLGLGYSFVEVHERSIGMDARLWTLATPVDGNLINLTLASQIREIRRPRRRVVGMAFLPVSLRTHLMNRFVLAQELLGVRQDKVIWSRKRYRPRPRLCRSDGEIMTYRAWCAQFYPGQDEVLQLPTERVGAQQLGHA